MGRDFYKILELEKGASNDDIRKSYKRLARQYHPDLNPNAPADKFNDITEAYETLNDPQKRELYDQYGEEGLKDGGMGGMGGFDDMGFFGFPGFGGPRRGNFNSGPQKAETVKQGLPVSLEELYNGSVRKIRVTRTRVCKPCGGVGASKKEAVVQCKNCNGVGMVNEIRQVAPGFISQVRKACSKCDGAGKRIDEKFICQSCNGKKVVSETKTLDIHIDKGMKNGQKIVFENEADEKPGVQAGDIVFILQEKPHNLFKRDGQNLMIEKKITLSEALTGTEFVIDHLDKRKLLVKSKAGEVIRPGQVKQVAREGMPQYRNPFDKGSLLIKFDVEFPSSITPDLASKLSSILPAKTKMEIDSDREEYIMEDAVIGKSSRGGPREAYDSDDDEEGHHHGQGISCASQ